ncbi:MAG: CoA transferase [Gammaproteobacteria bacterium]|nr:MAG: CoA transferase [Gammaproteobacteria bacterium]
MRNRPLDGIRVVEVGQLLAGPFAGTLLGYFGAEVIKVEPPMTGDPIRTWRMVDEDGTSFWWRSLARNKKSVTANLRSDAGRGVVKRLMTTADVVIENFKPGTMEKWGLGPDEFKESNPSLIYARISGYGQTGPYAKKPGFASVTEGFSGFRHLNGFPGEAPVRPNLSTGDTVAGLHAALGILLALIERRQANEGQVVDIALYESMFNLMEGVVPEYSGTGEIRGASGTTITGIVPTNTYPCSDGKYVVIGGNGDSIFVRLMEAMGRSDLAGDPALADNAGRVAQQDMLDQAIAEWTASLSAADVIARLEEAEVPVGLIYDVADMMQDPQYQARGMFEEVTVGDRQLTIPAILPRLARTPGFTDWPGPEVAEHRDEVLKAIGYSDEEIARLAHDGDV